MNKPALFVGIDVGSETFTVSIRKFYEKAGWMRTAKPTSFELPRIGEMD